MTRPPSRSPEDGADDRALELVAAWADDPGALTDAERAAVERLVARSDEARDDADATRELLGRLRAAGGAPDPAPPVLDQLGRDVRRAIDELAARRPWWRRWWAPALGLAAATAAAVVIMARAPVTPPPRAAQLPAPPPRDAGAAVPEDHATEVDEAAPLALGAAGEIAADDLDDAVLDEVRDALLADDELPPEDEPLPTLGLVPDLSLEWVDGLDDAELDAVARWLDEAG